MDNPKSIPEVKPKPPPSVSQQKAKRGSSIGSKQRSMLEIKKTEAQISTIQLPLAGLSIITMHNYISVYVCSFYVYKKLLDLT